jgi:glycosyltransferase involved in cell wall biosynthesis
MNILIDGRVWSRNAAGITTFLCCALMEWVRQRPGDTFHVVLPKGMDPSVELPALPANLHLRDYSSRFPRFLPNIVIMQLLVPYLCRKLHIGLYYAPVPHLPWFIPSSTKKAITVHDVVNIEMSHTMAWTNRLATSVFFGQAVRKADILWTNSHYTADKVEQYYPKRRCKDIFVGDAADHEQYRPLHLSEEERATVRQKYGIRDRFLLFVGSLEPRKNLSFLLRLMPELYREHHIQLVVVGGKGWKNSDLREIVEAPDYPRDAVIFCGYVTNHELSLLYNTADCFVSAALMEGFGMPQLEALYCGCPVVTAHNTAMIEVARGKDGAYTVEGYDPSDWKRAILHVLDSHPTVDQRQLAEYDWVTIIHQFLKEKIKQ